MHVFMSGSVVTENRSQATYATVKSVKSVKSERYDHLASLFSAAAVKIPLSDTLADELSSFEW